MDERFFNYIVYFGLLGGTLSIISLVVLHWIILPKNHRFPLWLTGIGALLIGVLLGPLITVLNLSDSWGPSYIRYTALLVVGGLLIRPLGKSLDGSGKHSVSLLAACSLGYGSAGWFIVIVDRFFL